jgi:hypothetical protein
MYPNFHAVGTSVDCFDHQSANDNVTELLRRYPARLMGSVRVRSNLIVADKPIMRQATAVIFWLRQPAATRHSFYFCTPFSHVQYHKNATADIGTCRCKVF